MAPALLCRATGGWSLPSLCHGVRICFPLSSASLFAKWSFSSCVMLSLSSDAGRALELSYFSNFGASALSRNATEKLRSCKGRDNPSCWNARVAVLRGILAVCVVYGHVETRGSDVRPTMRCFMVCTKGAQCPRKLNCTSKEYRRELRYHLSIRYRSRGIARDKQG